MSAEESNSFVLRNTSFCKELFDNFGNVTRDVKDADPGLELYEAYILMIVFGGIVLMFSYGYVYFRKKFHHDRVISFTFEHSFCSILNI